MLHLLVIFKFLPFQINRGDDVDKLDTCIASRLLLMHGGRNERQRVLPFLHPTAAWNSGASRAYSHREMTVSVEMSANGSFNEVPDRAVRTVNAHATFEKWEVWVNALNEDETEVRNNTSGATNGATVAFSIEGSSDGRLTNAVNRTNANGDTTVTDTMGSQTPRVWAAVE